MLCPSGRSEGEGVEQTGKEAEEDGEETASGGETPRQDLG